jgi:AcrR family transcriptional regulator
VSLRLTAILGRMAIGFPVPGRPLRADAQRNRERLLEAGRALFAARGLDVTMDEIAEHAGVGVGTAYRRFRNRDALVDALFEQRLLDYLELAEDALAEPDPWEALARFLERSAAIQAADRGLHELLTGDARTLARVARIREQILPLVERIVERARDAGAIRPDAAALDMPILSLMLGQVVDFSRDVEPELWRRYLALLLDGLRAAPDGGHLPCPPLAEAQLDAASSSWRPRRR